jgi:rare lipoprotein A (peptidoglycan hydrolase)
MPARRIAMLLVTCALAAPAAASADDPEPPSTGGTAAPEADPAFAASAHVMAGKIAEFRGSLPDDAGRTVTIERLDQETGTWVALATARIGDDGAYLARWRADVAGRMTTRATVEASHETGAALALAAPLESSMTVYRPALASWYGPGFYGRETACGVRMTRKLLGVAHKKLPCGTPVAITYEGNAITVPVVDRGPFVKGRRWDLTAAAAKALGFTYTDRLGAVRVD